MIRCEVLVHLPIRHKSTNSSMSMRVATYGFDLGYREGDLVEIIDAEFFRATKNGQPVSMGQRFSFPGLVISRKEFIKHETEQDVFLITLQVEIANKELIPEIVQALIRTFPEDYIAYKPDGSEECNA